MNSSVEAGSDQRVLGRVAVVTGSSSGNGRTISLALARAGATVVCSDIRKSALPQGFEGDLEVDTDDLIVAGGGKSMFVEANVTNASDVERLAQTAVSTYGRIDIWVNNAGVAIALNPIELEPLANWQLTIDVNLTGTWLGCKYAVAAMKGQEISGRGRGRIINIGSISGEAGQPEVGAYAASKGGVHALTRSLAIECAPHGINVNALAPGFLPTAMNRVFWDDPDGLAMVKQVTPWFELADASEVGKAVVFLASDDAAWITGVILPVDGGYLAR